MKVPLLLAWLAGLAPHRLKSEAISENALKKDETSLLLPPLEVLPSEVLKNKSFVTDTIRLEGGLTLLKGRLNATDLHHADNGAGKFEGGLRLSKCAVELVNILRREIQDGQLSFRGKRVLELGCGHGLPGIFACLKGASAVHFQDVSAEVLRNLTIPNVMANLELAQSQHTQDGGQGTLKTSQQLRPEIRYYAGDWSAMESILSLAQSGDKECARDHDDNDYSRKSVGDGSLGSIREGDSNQGFQNASPSSTVSKRALLSGSRAWERGNISGSLEGGYDIILMSETVYAAQSLPKLYNLIIKCLRPRYGVVYLAGKKHYYGSGGGTRHFKNTADDDGVLGAHLVADITDSSFNTKEVWKFFYH